MILISGCSEKGESISCTADAKICPDGSSVGRMPPNCQFAECPKQESGIGDVFQDNKNIEPPKAPE